MTGIVSLHACHEPVSLREALADSHSTHGLNAARRSGVPRDTIKFRASYSLLIPLECLVLWFVVALHQVQLSDISGPRLDEDVSQSYTVSFVVWFVVQTMLGPRVHGLLVICVGRTVTFVDRGLNLLGIRPAEALHHG